jgi:hypothetical protein
MSTLLYSTMSRHRHSLAFILLSSVICARYFPVLIGDRSLITNGPFHQPFFVGDPLAGGPITFPLERLASISWSHLQLPIIDPFQGYGIPLLANQGVPVYFPQLIVHFLFSGNYSIWIVLNVIAIAFGAYLLASSFGQRFPGAFAVGIAAALVGIVPPNLNMGMLNPFAVLPFVLVAIRYSLDPQTPFRRRGMLGTATSIAMLCLSGFQEVLPFMTFVIMVYAVALVFHLKTFRQRPGIIAWTAFWGFAGAVIGSIGILPTFAAVTHGAGINVSGSYLTHVPGFWLATLTMPSLTEHAMVGSPPDLGQTVWTLGSPIFIVTIVLSLALIVRPAGRAVRWYVCPSVVLVVFGILGYANTFDVLRVFDLPILTYVSSVRFLQFAWWLPWCLLLGAVISNVRHLRWYDATGALVLAGAFDWVFVVKFRDQLVARHLEPYLTQTVHAVMLAGAIAAAFLVVVLLVGWVTPRTASILMTAIVVMSSLYYLPANFYPASSDSAVNSLDIRGVQPPHDTYLSFVGRAPLPTTYYSVQVFSPVIPKPYKDVMSALFSTSETDGYGPIFEQVPTLGLATLSPRLLQVLGSLGVNQFVIKARLPTSTFGVISHCGSLTPVRSQSAVCLLGPSTNLGGPPASSGFAYELPGASPLVEANAHLVPVTTSNVGLTDLLRHLSSASIAFTDYAYVTADHRALRTARQVLGISRTQTLQSVTFALRSRTAGLVVLRASYFQGMRASVNGRSTSALPVDGGLWTAVDIGAGNSDVVLNYESTADRVELGLAVIGLGALALAWLVLAASSMREKRARVDPAVSQARS